MTLIEQLTEICHMLNARGYNFVVAGGFARDIALGVEPKDADICVFRGPDRMRPGVYEVPEAMLDWAQDNDLAVRQVPSYGDGDTDFDVRCAGVAKIGDVDIIFYRNEYSWQQVIAQFDFNLNQFYFPSSLPDYRGVAIPFGLPLFRVPYNPSFTQQDVAYGGDEHSLKRGLEPVRKDYCAARREYIESKYLLLKHRVEAWLHEHYFI